MKDYIGLDDGGGGVEMQALLRSFLPGFYRGGWRHGENDAASFLMHETLGTAELRSLMFTTDSYVVSPFVFPGGDIGHLAFSGTVNDLVVMGADPVGISLALVIEEGFLRTDLENILHSVRELSDRFQIPIVTGDTKVMEKGAVDGIVVNTSGIGFARQVLDKPLEEGDKIIISGGIGEHGVALLSQRFDFQSEIVSDSKPLVEEMQAIRAFIKGAKDPTRGGLAAALNEMVEGQEVDLEIWEKSIPVQEAVRSACDLLGLDPLVLANEGKLVCFVSSEEALNVLNVLRGFNSEAALIGELKRSFKKDGQRGQVVLKTGFGSRVLEMPSGKIVPRIC